MLDLVRPIADRNRIYVSTEEERRRDEEMSRLSSLIAVGVIAAPLAFIGSLIIKQGL